MSFYNMIFGVNKLTPVLLAALGLKLDDIPRLRDCFIHDDKIVIYTRTGGGNRAYYTSEACCRDNYPKYFDEGKDPPTGPWNENLTKNPFYLYDEDDDFDSTYANFYFRFPDEYAEDLKALSEESDTQMPSEKWVALIESLKSSNNAN